MKVEILANISELPQYETRGSSGMDIQSVESIMIPAGGRVLVHTDIRVAIPEGYEIQVRPRSGLALRAGITVLNTPGTVDSDYRGEIGVIMFNSNINDFFVNYGDRIAQIVLAKVERIEWESVSVLTETDRGSGGFGSTGV